MFTVRQEMADGPTSRPNRGRRLESVAALAAIGLLLVLSSFAITTTTAEPYGNSNNHQSGGGIGGVGIHIGGGINLGLGELLRCPKVCSCTGQSVDCSHRGLTQVPRRIPLDTEKL